MCSVARSLSAESVKAMVHAFISRRLDYCNSLLTEIGVCLLRRLQSVQNTAARLVTGPALGDVNTSRRYIEATALVACPAAHPLQADDSGAPGIDDCKVVADSGRRSQKCGSVHKTH